MLCSIHLCEKRERKCARIVTVTIGGKYKNLEALTVNHNNILCQHQSDPERTQEFCCWFCRWRWRSSFEIITFWIERFGICNHRFIRLVFRTHFLDLCGYHIELSLLSKFWQDKWEGLIENTILFVWQRCDVKVLAPMSLTVFASPRLIRKRNDV